MAPAEQIDTDTDTDTDDNAFLTVDEHELLKIFDDEKGFKAMIEKIEVMGRACSYDMSEAKERAACRRAARQIASAKTKIDGAGKDKTAEIAKIKARVDGLRKLARDRLDALKDDVRRPLTLYEEAESRAEAILDEKIEEIWWLATATIEDTSETITNRLGHIDAIFPGNTDWRKRRAEAEMVAQSAKDRLALARDLLVEREREEAELRKRLKDAEEAERKEAAAAKEAAARAAEEAAARAAEHERVLAEARAATERAEKAELEAAELLAHAKDEAQRKATAEALREEQRRQEEAEAKAKVEAKVAAISRVVRTADRVDEATVSLHAAVGLIETTCRKIVMAIAEGKVDHITMELGE